MNQLFSIIHSDFSILDSYDLRIVLEEADYV